MKIRHTHAGVSPERPQVFDQFSYGHDRSSVFAGHAFQAAIASHRGPVGDRYSL
jgi:hypothetical protein